jgi:hypothetical protein
MAGGEVSITGGDGRGHALNYQNWQAVNQLIRQINDGIGRGNDAHAGQYDITGISGPGSISTSPGNGNSNNNPGKGHVGNYGDDTINASSDGNSSKLAAGSGSFGSGQSTVFGGAGDSTLFGGTGFKFIGQSSPTTNGALGQGATPTGGQLGLQSPSPSGGSQQASYANVTLAGAGSSADHGKPFNPADLQASSQDLSSGALKVNLSGGDTQKGYAISQPNVGGAATMLLGDKTSIAFGDASQQSQKFNLH